MFLLFTFLCSVIGPYGSTWTGVSLLSGANGKCKGKWACQCYNIAEGIDKPLQMIHSLCLTHHAPFRFQFSPQSTQLHLVHHLIGSGGLSQIVYFMALVRIDEDF